MPGRGRFFACKATQTQAFQSRDCGEGGGTREDRRASANASNTFFSEAKGQTSET